LVGIGERDGLKEREARKEGKEKEKTQ